ncbi:ABC transporter permease [Gloeothece citriformis]|nr:ABC transporter permease [Gloeothece citriformis]
MGRDLIASRELAWQLMKRDIQAEYRQSILGYCWAFLPALVTATGLTLASRSKVLNVGVTDIPYPAFVMISMVLWQTFTESLNGPVQMVTKSKQMLARVNFPREALLVATVGKILFNLGIKLILVIGIFLWYRISISWSIFLAPVALIHLMLLGIAIGTFLCPFAMLYQDFSKGIVLMTGFWLFLTPVFFPEPKGAGSFATLVRLNPVTPLLVTTRELATTGAITNEVGFWIASLIAIGGFLIAWLMYRLAMPFVIERISS